MMGEWCFASFSSSSLSRGRFQALCVLRARKIPSIRLFGRHQQPSSIGMNLQALRVDLPHPPVLQTPPCNGAPRLRQHCE